MGESLQCTGGVVRLLQHTIASQNLLTEAAKLPLPTSRITRVRHLVVTCAFMTLSGMLRFDGRAPCLGIVRAN